MWSELDELVITFIRNFEEQLSRNDDIDATLRLDNLQVSISLDQRSNPPIVSWNVTVRDGKNRIYNIGLTNPKELEPEN